MVGEHVQKSGLAPFREVSFPAVDLEIETRPDGVLVITPRQPLEIGVASVPAGLARSASRFPGKIHLAERDQTGDWRRRTFEDVRRDSDAVAQWLMNRSFPAGRPLMILSGNSIAHAVARYGAMAAGVPVCPISANYALLGAAGGFERLRYLVDLIRPAAIFAEDARYAAGVRAIADPDTMIVSLEPEAFGGPGSAGIVTGWADVVATTATRAVAERIASLDPDAPAAYMLTSGSTGRPKAVIQTQRMIVSNLHQGWQVLGQASGWDDVMLEWLPWSHVSGAFTSMAAAVFGGTLYIDGGRPLPGLFAQTIRNLSEIPLRYFANVPSGYAMLADALEADAALRATFFRDLRMMLYGGAGLPQALYDRIQRAAVATTGKRIFFTTGYGATETSSGCMSIYFPTEEVGIGLPMPGLSLKMVPIDDRYELRLKGPMVTPGYLGAPELNASMFDEDGFYRIGDTARFHDPANPARGLAFAGRLAEEFKLSTGTWVCAGELRAQILKVLSPLVADLLICGENRDSVAVLAWPTPATLAKADGLPHALAMVADRLRVHNAAHPGSSTRIAHFAFLAEPPNVEAYEVSDKGTVNQALARRRRVADIERVYAEPSPDDVLAFQHSVSDFPAHPGTP